MQKLVIVLLALLGVISATGQKKWDKYGFKPVPPVCYASDETRKSFVPPPEKVLNQLKSAEKSSEIIVSYSFFPDEAKEAFEYAVDIWERLIDSPVPVYIQANWRPKDENVLGSCAPSDFERNFEGAPRPDIYYPIATVEKITGTEFTGPNRPDMVASFNEDINWYYGTDGDTPDQLYDFVTVVLHEIGHGLGFTGFFYVEDDMGAYGLWETGDATSFDLLVEQQDGSQLLDTAIFENPSLLLNDALVSNNLYANSPVAINDYNDTRPRLYAPSDWDSGSSVYHLNDATYPSRNPNSLMTHSFGRGQAVHDPGPVTLGILADIGWENLWIEFEELKDREQVDSVRFEAKITSDYEIDSTRLFVVYSTDFFESHIDSLPLVAGDSTVFHASLLPEPETTSLQYYLSAADKKDRVFRKPAGAPDDYYVLHFGPDNVEPEIEHEPIPYFFDTEGDLEIFARVTDNLGVDTVFVEYSINGAAQDAFGLTPDSGAVFSGVFPLSNFALNDGDEIKYSITAQDASDAQNTRTIPSGDVFSFNIEKMFDPIGSYVNDFNSPTPDFILSDFDIYEEDNFENGALHSPHPYPSPDEDDAEFNFTTILKRPVILNEEALLAFDEIVLVEPGSPGTQYGDFEFWDYVIAEGSNNQGKTWLPLADGYDSRDNSTWEENYNESITEMNSSTVGTPEWYVRREIDMLENGNFSVGDTILIRFRLFSDPYAHGWGWAIDNLQVQAPVSVQQPVLSPGNISAWPNPFNRSFRVKVEPVRPVDELQLTVYNMYGQIVKSVTQKNVTGVFSTKIELEKSASGIYFLKVAESGKQVFTKKMIQF